MKTPEEWYEFGMARVPRCDFKDDGCDDPRCKIGACAMALKEQSDSMVLERQRGHAIEAEAIKIIRMRVRMDKRRDASPTEIERNLRNPEVLALAQKWLDAAK